MALTDKLSAIGVAIRAKTGKSDLLTLDQMPTEIASITTGGGGGNEPTAEELVIEGSGEYMFYEGKWDWAINRYGNLFTTNNITSCREMFHGTTVKTVPFVINIGSSCANFENMFNSAQTLETCPKIRGTIPWSTSATFSGTLESVPMLRDAEDLFTPEMLDGFSTVKVTSKYTYPKTCKFTYMRSMRQVPSWFYKFKLNPESTNYPSSSGMLYYMLFANCFVVDEITNIPVWACTGELTSNIFSDFCQNCSRTKNITFETQEDGSPYVVKWKSQTIGIQSVGYDSNNNVTRYNSGITEAKKVTDDATYQALKDDPDWYTADVNYSRYNHDSAVATINSLPDTSAYLATAGGTNTIRFYGKSGSNTDGGAINTLTEEEIAVAAAKGWTVSIT